MKQLMHLFRLTWSDPREAAHAVLSIPVPKEAVWLVIIATSTLSALVAALLQIAVPAELPEGVSEPLPWVLAIRQFAQLAILIVTVYWGGKMLDGRGSFGEVAVALSWVQFYSIPLQLGVLMIVVVAPLIGAFLFMAVAIYILYLLVVFIDIAHQLGSAWKAAKMLLLIVIALALGLSVFLTLTQAGM